MKKLQIYVLTIKYWLQGDDWQFAKEYATALVMGFKIMMNPNPKTKRTVDKNYLAWIKTQSCAISNANCIGDIVAHHSSTKGAGGSDYLTIPLCIHHHRLVHQMGRYSFQSLFSISFTTRIIQLLKRYPRRNGVIEELLKKLRD